ncbi:hypothetical protein [Methylobacterium nonmethylotrophicum]|uniref:hypothetical protein n=1 Tax=Methylobacterium nonmethylotrophicum TaxID=1141884 RepID=UPI001436C15D|nr:hypothetical protein [Methylobacterium nonmethylotrophicum]
MLRLDTRLADARRAGIDDWAIRKDSRCGAAAIDLDRHREIDLLPDRAALTLSAWLERHFDVRLIA